MESATDATPTMNGSRAVLWYAMLCISTANSIDTPTATNSVRLSGDITQPRAHPRTATRHRLELKADACGYSLAERSGQAAPGGISPSPGWSAVESGEVVGHPPLGARRSHGVPVADQEVHQVSGVLSGERG